MATHTYSKDRSSQININASNDTWIVAASATVDVSGTSAIYESSAFDRATVVVRGTVMSNDPGFAAILFEGFGNVLTVEGSGRVEGIHAITAGPGGKVTNRGEIWASLNGVEAPTFVNHGEVDAQMGVLLRVDGARMTNGENGRVIASDTAIYDDAAGQTGIVNHGLLKGTNFAVNALGDGEMTLENRGRIAGEVYLGAGADMFINKGGTAGTFAIRGGDGDDFYRIDAGDLKLREAAGEGYDTVSTSASFVLPGNFEQLVLRGQGKLFAHGNDGDNVLIDNNAGANVFKGFDGADEIYGGAGANTLHGGKGEDTLVSGTGDERMIGGGQADRFAFSRGSGRDEIMDFADGVDRIDLGAYAGMDDFGDLAGRIDTLGDDARIRLKTGDVIFLRDFDAGDVDAGDFSFL